MFRLHFNKSLKNFTVRRADRSVVYASEHRAKLPLIGDTVPLAPSVHIIITRGDFEKAIDKKTFETALNFREGMERNRDELVKEFS